MLRLHTLKTSPHSAFIRTIIAGLRCLFLTVPLAAQHTNRLSLEESTDLKNWQNVPVTAGMIDANGNLLLPSATPERFYRMKVESLIPAGITTQPAATSITSGQAATLTVSASGSEPFTYQWYEGSVGTTTRQVGTNSPSFTTPALTIPTSYWVRVSNPLNYMNSSAATVKVTGGEDAEFFLRAGVSDPRAREDISEFIAGAKSLGIWEKLVYVPCLSTHGGLHQMGGAYQRTGAPWTAVNCTVDAEGVRIVKADTSNHLLTAQKVDTRITPMAFGTMSSQLVTPNAVIPQFYSAMLEGSSSTWYDRWLMGMEWTSSDGALNMRARHGILPLPNHFFPTKGILNNYANSHMFAISSNGTANYECAIDHTLSRFTHTSAISYDGSKALRFYPPVQQNGGAGLIQGAFLYYGNFADLGFDVWRKLNPLINQTLLSGRSSHGYGRYILSGQSNASGSLAAYIQKYMGGYSSGQYAIYNTGHGGEPIDTWIGQPGNNSRTATYNGTLWSSGAIAPENGWQQTDIPYGKKTDCLIWFQGENDTGTLSSALAYREQLATLIRYIRADCGNPNLQVVVVQIDYEHNLRCANQPGFTSNLSLSGFGQALSALNGTYTIKPLTANHDPYEWRNGAYLLVERANRWCFVDTATDFVIASAQQTALPHPAMVTNWVNHANAAITPTVSAGTRTENIERVRYAQRQIIHDLPNVYTFDSRTYSRAEDYVHLISSIPLFAQNLSAYLESIR